MRHGKDAFFPSFNGRMKNLQTQASYSETLIFKTSVVAFGTNWSQPEQFMLEKIRVQTNTQFSMFRMPEKAF